MDRQVRAGAHFCATTRRTLPRSIYSLSRPLASTCSLPSSLFGWTGESWSGSTLHKILRQNGSRARVAFAALLSVGNNIEAGSFLVADGKKSRIVLRLFQK